jgi:hypothetical protein
MLHWPDWLLVVPALVGECFPLFFGSTVISLSETTLSVRPLGIFSTRVDIPLTEIVAAHAVERPLPRLVLSFADGHTLTVGPWDWLFRAQANARALRNLTEAIQGRLEPSRTAANALRPVI